MGFFKRIIGGFREAAKAGEDFNPMLEKVMEEVETLHASGKLDDVVYKAEQAYVKEHGAYTAKGTHTNAADSFTDVKALGHFMKALEDSLDDLSPELKENAQKVLDLKYKMEHILNNAKK